MTFYVIIASQGKYFDLQYLLGKKNNYGTNIPDWLPHKPMLYYEMVNQINGSQYFNDLKEARESLTQSLFNMTIIANHQKGVGAAVVISVDRTNNSFLGYQLHDSLTIHKGLELPFVSLDGPKAIILDLKNPPLNNNSIQGATCNTQANASNVYPPKFQIT